MRKTSSHTNRLIGEKSPYLLQHAHNPVDWYPWGPEAFEKAKKEHKPIFLSVGYSSCHWCHVMEHESFENDDVADLLNRHFVAIKVDREERPDIDEIYMLATQIIAGRGGWPNSVWLTSDGRPWFAGTYFPLEDRHGRPGFKTVLNKLDEIWTTRPKDVEAQAQQLANAIRQATSHAASAHEPISDTEILQEALHQFNNNYDPRHGGFGAAPKFPPHTTLAFLLSYYERHRDTNALRLATNTLDAMALGGIHDHIGGGFHRYSTDERWLLPHFEKMLYDNAQLARVYTDAFRITGQTHYRDVADDILDWVLREMTAKEGGFYSALDADSEDEEGKFYIWRHEEIVSILGPNDGELFCKTYNILPGGNYHEEATGQPTGLNIPHLSAPTQNQEHADRLRNCRKKLLDVRAKRVWPGLDDKIITAWNGLMIGSFALAGREFQEPRYTTAAEKAADFILTRMRRDGVLLRTYRDGEAKIAGYLDDYAFLTSGLIDLYEATSKQRWLNEAEALTKYLIKEFEDAEQGGFFYTSMAHETLIARTKDPFDQALPSGNGMAACVLLKMATLTGKKNYEEKAHITIQAFSALFQRAPTGLSSLLQALITSAGSQQKSWQPVTMLTLPPKIITEPNATVQIIFEVNIEKGWHINSSQPKQDHMLPMRIELTPHSIVQAFSATYPKCDIYQGTVRIPATIHIADVAPKGAHVLEFRMSAQPCDDTRCLAPITLKAVVPIGINF